MRNITTWEDLARPGNATDFFERRAFPAFEPDAAGFSPANALWLAELCRLAYRHDKEENDPPPQPSRTSFLDQAGLKQRSFFLSRKTDTQAMLVKSGGASPYAVLVFRGTEQTLGDYITDLKIGMPPFGKPEIVVHKGFQQALASVWSYIDAALARLDCPVFYTGHSLGGALATLAAARRPPRATYTFGSPRVGNQAFVDALAALPIHRFVDGRDIVTTLPPESLGYRHAGKEYRLSAPADTRRRLLDPPKPMADHAPINYVDRIQLP